MLKSFRVSKIIKNINIKNSILQFIWVICFTLAMVGCSQKEELEPSPQKEVAEETSEIALLEKQTGIELFKKDVTLQDKSGKNQVVMRFAAKDEALLKDYLELTDISMSLVYTKSVKSNKANPQSTPNQITPKNESIFAEIISKSLDQDAIGYQISWKSKKFENGRTSGNGFEYDTQVFSETWPEECNINTYAPLRFHFDAKGKWYASYSSKSFCDSFSGQCGSTFYPYGQSYNFWVDGPYKVRLTIDYDYASDFDVQFVNH